MLLKISKSGYTVFLLLIGFCSQAQDLMNIADSATIKPKEYSASTFKTTRNINFHTLESLGKRTLDFRISHRFGPVNSGSYELWGIDQTANIRLGLEYSPDGRFMFGAGRSSYEKMYDGFLKYRLVRQTTDNNTPLSITLFSGMYYTSQKDQSAAQTGFDKYEYASSRLSYVYQVMVGRKFNSNFSFQLAPYLVHYNLVNRISDKNDSYGVAFVTRMKYTKRQAITAEYGYRISKYSHTDYYNSFGIGWEVETGGHVFQVHVTNSYGIADNQYLMYTTSKWNNMGIRLGFNISRVFNL